MIVESWTLNTGNRYMKKQKVRQSKADISRIWEYEKLKEWALKVAQYKEQIWRNRTWEHWAWLLRPSLICSSGRRYLTGLQKQKQMNKLHPCQDRFAHVNVKENERLIIIMLRVWELLFSIESEEEQRQKEALTGGCFIFCQLLFRSSFSVFFGLYLLVQFSFYQLFSHFSPQSF